MAHACIFSLVMGNLCLLWAVQPMTVSPATSSASQRPQVLTRTRGESVLLRCPVPPRWGGRSFGVRWDWTPAAGGPAREIPSAALPPRFSFAADRASLRIERVALRDAGAYRCALKTLGEPALRGTGTELRVLAPPTAPQLFLQVPPGLWAGQWDVFCVTGGFYPHRPVRLSWTQNSTESQLQDCTPGSADPGPVQSSGLVLDPGSAPNGWLPVGLVTEEKPQSRQRCVYVTDSSGWGAYLVSVLPLPLGPGAGATYTCTVRDHPALPTTLSASFSWEPPSSEGIRCLNIAKICLLSGASVLLTVAAVRRLFKKREACRL